MGTGPARGWEGAGVLAGSGGGGGGCSPLLFPEVLDVFAASCLPGVNQCVGLGGGRPHPRWHPWGLRPGGCCLISATHPGGGCPSITLPTLSPPLIHFILHKAQPHSSWVPLLPVPLPAISSPHQKIKLQMYVLTSPQAALVLSPTSPSQGGETEARLASRPSPLDLGASYPPFPGTVFPFPVFSYKYCSFFVTCSSPLLFWCERCLIGAFHLRVTFLAGFCQISQRAAAV